jgi:hypothetical protein
MNDEWLKIVGVVVVLGFLIYLAAKSLKIHRNMMEGLTMPTDTSAISPGVTSGQAGTANAYAAAIKAQVIKMQDVLLITKYRTDYENVIINMDDYINLLMLQAVLNLDTSSDSAATNIAAINSLNTLQSAKVALNSTMKFIDGTV